MQILRTKPQFLLIVVWNYFSFYVLTLLSKTSPPLPERTANRFARSAAKRDPLFATPENIGTILTDGAFQPAFCFGRRGAKMSRAAAVRVYLSQIHSGVDPRKPEPGFHPYVFAQEMAYDMETRVDPYAAFLQAGRPDGPWMVPVIIGGDRSNVDVVQPTVKTALHIHAFYIDQLDGILARLAVNQSRPDLFVSVQNQADADSARRILAAYAGKVSQVAVFPNAGRDIGPLLTGFGPMLIRDYDVIGHLHTKKSLFAKKSQWVDDWVDFLFSNLIGSDHAGPMADLILNGMQDDEKIGIVYPDDPHIPGWGVNRADADMLAEKMSMLPLPEAFNFPVGTMFWMRRAALKRFVDLDLTWDDYPAEPLSNDGTMLHALERLFGVVPADDGHKTVVTHLPGISR